jgi:hypothetical protein
MNVRQIGRGYRHAGHDFGLLALQRLHARLHHRLIHPVLDRGEKSRNAAIDLFQRPAISVDLGAALMVQAVVFLMIGPHRLDHRIGRGHAFGKTGEDTLFDDLAADCPVIVTGAASMMV